MFAPKNACRLRALVAVARAYRLAPRPVEDGTYRARCPGCARRGPDRSLVIRPAQSGARFECRKCGAQGAKPNGLQRLAEGRYGAENDDTPPPVDLPRIRAALARLDDAIEAHGDLAREVCDDAADALESAAELPDVQAANDDVEVCRCPDCEGRGDAGEGDA